MHLRTLTFITNTSGWLTHIKNDISGSVPVIVNTSGVSANKTVDVFFVHSAGFVGPGSWNSNMQSENSEA
jgi:hypothetical protein